MPDIKENVPLAPYTTFKIGGPAEYFAVAESEEGLAALAGYARQRRQPITILGGGSNVLISDAGIKGLVIKIDIRGLEHQEEGREVRLSVGAGESWDDLVAYSVERGWWGIENLSAIPGTVGAAPIQNIGAYGTDVSSAIQSVRAYDLDAERFVELSVADCAFSYRDSIFKTEAGRRLVVTRVEYRLGLEATPVLRYQDLADRFAGDLAPTAAAIRAAVIDIRAGKFPDLARYGTAGSFFKNPIIPKEAYDALKARYPELPGFPEVDGRVKVSLGWILDKVCGLKGARQGQVGTFERQSLVMVNHGGATATEVKAFARRVEEEVFQRSGISIEWEVNAL